MNRIALFGTSADPPTISHQLILEWLALEFDWVAVWAADNPFKSQQTPLQHRVAMLRLLIEEINASPQKLGQHSLAHENLQLYPELSHPRTLLTVEQARQWWPAAELTLVIGSDLMPQLPRWYHIETLLKQVKLLVIQRPDCPITPADLEPLQQLGAEAAIAPLVMRVSVSSTAYREKGDATALSPSVTAYISQEHLYEWQNAAPARVQIQ